MPQWMWSQWSAREAPRHLGAVGIAEVDTLGEAQRPLPASDRAYQLRIRGAATAAADSGAETTDCRFVILGLWLRTSLRTGPTTSEIRFPASRRNAGA